MLYIVSIRIDRDVADDWESWMRDVHVPDVIETGCFVSAAIARDRDADTDARRAYRIVYRTESRDAYDRYVDRHADALQADHTHRYEGQFDASRDLLPVVDAWQAA